MRHVPLTACALILGTAGAAWPQQDQAPTLIAVASDEHGSYVAIPGGMPVYAFLTSTEIGGDGQDPLDSCNIDCREFWKLVTVEGEVSVGEGLDPDLVETSQVDGETLLLYGDHPLFVFTRDAPGEPPEGQGIYSYGGYWALLTPSGHPIRTVPMEEEVDVPATPDND